MATRTRTVLSDMQHQSFVSIDGVKIVPRCITRFPNGTRVEVRGERGGYYVQPVENCSLRIFGEEQWHESV